MKFHTLALIFILLLVPDFALAKGPVPPAGESGLSEKALRQSQPESKKFPKAERPVIILKDSRNLKEAGAGPSFFVRRIEIEGNTLFDDKTLAPMVDVGREGMEMTLGVLALMAQEITAYYVSEGYFLTRAYVPEQEARDGVVKIRVAEGRIGKLDITGNKKIRKKDLLRRLKKVRKEKVLKEQTLETVLTELNELMGVKVRSILRPGDLPGTSDLMLEVTETPPYTFGFDTDNFGSDFTGRTRFGTTGAVGNIFTLGDQFSIRGVKSDQSQNFAQGSYLFPLTECGTTAKLSYTFSEQNLGAGLVALNAGGHTKIFDAELAQNLYRTRSSQFKLRMAFSSSHYRNFLLNATSGKESLLGFTLSLGGNFQDPLMGQNFLDLGLYQGLSEEDQSRDLASRAGGRGNITKATINYTRYQGTGFMNTYFIGKFNAQMSSDRVLSPDLFSAGGMGTVRGFPLAEKSGDGGYLLSLEYVVPVPWKKRIGIKRLTLNQILSFTGFLDYAEVFVRDNHPGEEQDSITGTGGGIQITIPKIGKWVPAMSFNASYGLPIRGTSPSDGSQGLWYLNGALNYYF